MKIAGATYYKKGVSVSVIKETVIDPLTLAASFNNNTVVGYTPKDDEKPVKEHGWGLFTYNGVKYLALKSGYTYEVTLNANDKESVEIISVDSSDAIIPVMDGIKVSVKRHKKQ